MEDEEAGLSRVDVAAYIFGILLALLGSGNLSDGLGGLVGGILFILTGLLLIPLTRPILLGIASSISVLFGGPDFLNISRGVFVLIVVVGAVSGSIIMPPSSPDNSATVESPTVTETPESTSTPTPTPTPTPRTLTLSSPTPTESSDTTTESGTKTDWVVTVVSVTDGDTMDVRMPDGSIETIRLLGVDTPETSASDTSPGEWEGIPETTDGRQWLANWGGEASSYAEERLAGKEIYITTDPKSDRRGTYDRLLVYAYQSEDSEKSFNLRLIESGYARMYDSQFTKRTEFEAAEATAEQNNIGVWDYTETTSTPSTDGGTSGSGEIVVASVHADAEGNDHENLNDEYIVLRNDGDSPVDMDGWTLSDSADHTYYFPSGFTLGAGESVTIYTGSGSDSDTELYWGSSSAIWNNSGDTIIVTTDSGETVIEYEY